MTSGSASKSCSLKRFRSWKSWTRRPGSRKGYAAVEYHKNRQSQGRFPMKR